MCVVDPSKTTKSGRRRLARSEKSPQRHCQAEEIRMEARVSTLTALGWGAAEFSPNTEYDQRRAFTQRKIEELNAAIAELAPDHDQWRDACVYITGSMARDEAFNLSDLDLFIMDDFTDGVPRLTPIRHAELLAGLNQARQIAGFRPFSRGGSFLENHSFQEMMQQTGTPTAVLRSWIMV
jgi:predicted nucleotidyltransferase